MKKSFGQHFLNDQTIAQKIVDLAELDRSDFVIEVGPGAGVLTQEIIKQVEQENVTLIEADRDLLPKLEHNFYGVKIIQDDAGNIDYDKITQDRSWKFVSNLPYNAGNAILMKVLSSRNPPSKLVIMLQKEVADRIVAQPGQMSLLSVAVRMYADPTKIFDVKPESFNPPPKVISSVLVLDFAKKHENPESIIKLAKIGFSSRRKQLHKNIANTDVASSDKVKQALLSLDLPETARAQELNIKDWINLESLLKRN